MDAGIINYNDGPGETPAPQPTRKKGKGGLVLLSILVAAAGVAGGVL